MKTINYCATMGLASQEVALREALQVSRRRTTAPERSNYVRNLTLDLFSRGKASRAKAIEMVLAVAYDAFKRGAPQADVREFGLVFLAIVDSWYARDHRTITTIAELHADEERAEGEKESAEVFLAHNPGSSSARRVFLEKSAAYDVANQRLVDYVRQLCVPAADRDRAA